MRILFTGVEWISFPEALIKSGFNGSIVAFLAFLLLELLLCLCGIRPTRADDGVKQIALSASGSAFAASVGSEIVIRSGSAYGSALKLKRFAMRTVTSLAISGDERLVAAGDEEGGIFVWRFGEADPVFEVDKSGGQDATVAGVAFSGDGKNLVVGTWDRRIRVWRIADGSEVTGMRLAADDSDFIAGVAVSGGGAEIVGASHHHQLGHFAFGTWSSRSVPLTGGYLSTAGPRAPRNTEALAFSDEGKYFAVCYMEGGAERRDGGSGTVLQVLFRTRRDCSAIAISKDGKEVVEADEGGIDIFVDGSRSQPVRLRLDRLTKDKDVKISSVAVSQSGGVVLVGMSDGRIVLLSDASGGQIGQIRLN